MVERQPVCPGNEKYLSQSSTPSEAESLKCFKPNSRSGLLGKTFPSAMCQLLTAKSGHRGMLKAER